MKYGMRDDVAELWELMFQVLVKYRVSYARAWQAEAGTWWSEFTVDRWAIVSADKVQGLIDRANRLLLNPDPHRLDDGTVDNHIDLTVRDKDVYEQAAKVISFLKNPRPLQGSMSC